MGKIKRYVNFVLIAVMLTPMLFSTSMPVSAVPPTITTVALPNGAVGIPYNQTITATGSGNIAWCLNWIENPALLPATRVYIDEGMLPPGLTISSISESPNRAVGGLISGTPTQTGTWNFTLRATNAAGTTVTSGTFSITINNAPAIIPPTITTTEQDLLIGIIGTTSANTPAYNFTFLATGSTPTWTWSSNNAALPPDITLPDNVTLTLPPGLNLNSSTGAISGTPTQAGTFTFIVRAANAAGSDTRVFTIKITRFRVPNPITPTVPVPPAVDSIANVMQRNGIQNNAALEDLVNNHILGINNNGVPLLAVPGSVRMIGNNAQIGFFEVPPNMVASTVLPFDRGIVLATDNVTNTFTGLNGRFACGNDICNVCLGVINQFPGLAQGFQAVTNNTRHHNPSALEFQIIADSTNILFEYFFASHEYGPDVNDGFGLWVRINGGAFNNIALLPNGNFVNVNNTRNGTPFHRGFTQAERTAPQPFNFPGRTIPLTAAATVNVGDVVTIRMGIADASDTIIPSAVFIRANSFVTLFDPVEEIINIPTKGIRGVPLPFAGSPLPNNATAITELNRNIIWTLESDPHGITGLSVGDPIVGVLPSLPCSASNVNPYNCGLTSWCVPGSPGILGGCISSVFIRATIEDGVNLGNNFTEVFGITLYPSLPPYTVTFLLEPDQNPPWRIADVNDGSTVPKPNPDPTKIGHIFDGWYTCKDFITEYTDWDFNNTPVHASFTLYAKWEPILITVIFDTDSVVPIPPAANVPPSQIVIWGNTVNIPAPPSKTGFAFGGWYTTPTFNAGTQWNFATNTVTPLPGIDTITLYAKWLLEYTVIFDITGGDPPSPDSQTIPEGGFIRQPANPTKTSHRFIGWYTEETGGTRWDFYIMPVMTNMTLYARW
jgi:uncharacterized repeat protein (TIGR02543 family)